MSLFELVFFVVLVALVILCSRCLSHFSGVPQGLAVIPVIGSLVLLLSLLKASSRGMWIISSLFTLATLLSMGLAELLRLRNPVFAAPFGCVLVIVAIQIWHRFKRNVKAETQDS